MKVTQTWCDFAPKRAQVSWPGTSDFYETWLTTVTPKFPVGGVRSHKGNVERLCVHERSTIRLLVNCNRVHNSNNARDLACNLFGVLRY
jgi:hypothetical protein